MGIGDGVGSCHVVSFASRENRVRIASAYRDTLRAGSVADAGICLAKVDRSETIPWKMADPGDRRKE
jgi:hypothetical protein